MSPLYFIDYPMSVSEKTLGLCRSLLLSIIVNVSCFRTLLTLLPAHNGKACSMFTDEARYPVQTAPLLDLIDVLGVLRPAALWTWAGLRLVSWWESAASQMEGEIGRRCCVGNDTLLSCAFLPKQMQNDHCSSCDCRGLCLCYTSPVPRRGRVSWARYDS